MSLVLSEGRIWERKPCYWELQSSWLRLHYISNIIAFAGGIAGLLIAIIGFFMRDNAQKH